MRGCSPAWKFGINWLASGQDFHIVRDVIVAASPIAVSHADLNRFDSIEAIDISDRKLVNAVHNRRMACSDRIEPAATPRAASSRAKFTAHGMQHIGDLSVLAWQR